VLSRQGSSVGETLRLWMVEISVEQVLYCIDDNTFAEFTHNDCKYAGCSVAQAFLKESGTHALDAIHSLIGRRRP
jgi:hypothetical protein